MTEHMNDLLKKHNFQSWEEARNFCMTFWSSSLDSEECVAVAVEEKKKKKEKECDVVDVAEEDTEEKQVKKNKKAEKKKNKVDNQKDKSGNEWQRIIPIKIPGQIAAGTKLEKRKIIWDYILSNKDSINNPDYDSIIKGRLRGANMGIDIFNDLHKSSYEQNKVGETIEKAHLNQKRDVAGFTDHIRKHVTEEVRPYRIGIYNGSTYVIGFIPV